MAAKVITIAQQKGGAGKTTCAAHLAVALSEQGYRVALVDIDPQKSLTNWYEARCEAFGEEETGLDFVSVSGWRVSSEISRLKTKADIVIVDSPPHTESEAKSAIRYADLVVVPIQPSPMDLWATQATLDIAHSENVPVKLVMNRVPPNSRLARAITEQLEGLSVSMLGNRVIFASALMEGLGVTEAQPNSAAAEEIELLAEEVMGAFALDSLPIAGVEHAQPAQRL